MTDLTITLAQINPTVGNLPANAQKILDIWRCADSGLVVFPELCLTGYPPEDLVLKPAFLEHVRAFVAHLCAQSQNFPAAALIGCPWDINGKTYNTLHLIEHGEIRHTTAKHHLPDYGVFDESRIFTAGPLPAPVPFRSNMLGLMICEDMWHADVAAHLKAQGAEILIVSNASPFEVKKLETRLDIARARVSETGLNLIYVNQVGGQDELVFDGHSFVIEPSGDVSLQMKGLGEDSQTVSSLRKQGSMNTFLQEDPCFRRDDTARNIHAALTLALKDYVHKNGFSGILLGLSGGIDSALSAVIAVEALGPKNVHCVMMPSKFTTQDSLDDAAALAQNLGCTYEIIPISGPLHTFEHLLPDLKGLAHENTQSRIRGLILMAMSNATGKMVLSTGNKSEMAVGYATLYGDMCGGFNVLKDLYKTQVYALSHWLNARKQLIPERILTKAPTAELRENQTDQDSLPPYDILDDILECLIEHDMGAEEIEARGHSRATILRVWGLLDRAEYKRRQSAPGPKITPRAFGKDRRMPITNHFREND